ncbi:hypothetical protein FA10DRAFT_257975 [Acaromyces ingoldii]|uniref:Uncharacterized protein n=1 Tax=Acaromyces ingoldii TaxID=215250 RepID=A0A316YW05_9BASI|nr:hypothetical protein FA10DRAFT_257975 [Acaromyces ingoldii]PWN93740.1 hypothetical protein FA10DRAFT_257975 [Acaromyces ingoldii]
MSNSNETTRQAGPVWPLFFGRLRLARTTIIDLWGGLRRESWKMPYIGADGVLRQNAPAHSKLLKAISSLWAAVLLFVWSLFSPQEAISSHGSAPPRLGGGRRNGRGPGGEGRIGNVREQEPIRGLYGEASCCGR